jgi:hypothetical protein
MRSDRKNRPKQHQGLAADRQPEAYRLLKDGRIDGRSLHRTGRTVNLTVRVSAGFDEELREFAIESGMRMGEIVERSVRHYRKALGRSDAPAP